MDKPAHGTEDLSVTGVLDYLNTSQSSPHLTEQIDSWLEETYPSGIHPQYPHSESLTQIPIRRSPRKRNARSAPPAMPLRISPSQGRRSGRRVSTPGLTDAGAFSRDRSGSFPESSISGTSSGGTTGSSVENAQYEAINLAANNIIYRDRRDKFPNHISHLVESITSDGNLPDLSIQDFNADDALASLERGAGEPSVEQYIQNTLVKLPHRNDALKRSDKIPMSRKYIPNTGTTYRDSGPVPDILLGYNLAGAFTPLQRMKLASMNLSSANNDGLCLPFFILEFKGDGPSSNGSL